MLRDVPSSMILPLTFGNCRLASDIGVEVRLISISILVVLNCGVLRTDRFLREVTLFGSHLPSLLCRSLPSPSALWTLRTPRPKSAASNSLKTTMESPSGKSENIVKTC